MDDARRTAVRPSSASAASYWGRTPQPTPASAERSPMRVPSSGQAQSWEPAIPATLITGQAPLPRTSRTPRWRPGDPRRPSLDRRGPNRPDIPKPSEIAPTMRARWSASSSAY